MKNIEWTNKTWNPVIGCQNNCAFGCWARNMNNRFKFIADWTKPQFFENRLIIPNQWKKPQTIAVCLMSDLFGSWIPHEWIRDVVRVANENHQHVFQFLTRNPSRYHDYQFEQNCWLGTTMCNESDLKAGTIAMKSLINFRFISFEPLLGDIPITDLTWLDLAVVGGLTGRKAIFKVEWLENIAASNPKQIMLKNNLRKYLTPNEQKRFRKYFGRK